MSDLVSLSKYIPVEKQHRVDLSITPAAIRAGRVFQDFRSPVGSPEWEKEERYLEKEAASYALNFLEASYMQFSPWFIDEPVHRVKATQFFRFYWDGRETVQHRCYLHLCRQGDRWVIMAPEEAPLSENYFEQRLMAEVQIDGEAESDPRRKLL